MSESDLTVSEERVSLDTASGEGFGTGERNYYDWYGEPDPQDPFMLRVEGNISANQAWVDFLKGEVPDYTEVDFSDDRFSQLGRAFILQDMEGYSLNLEAYGVSMKEYAAGGGQITSIQIFPYNIDTDEEEELLFICNSYAGMVKLWVLDEMYEDTWCLYPSVSNWAQPGIPGRIWLWTDGILCYQEPDNHMENCPDRICFYQIGERLAFALECNRYQSSDSIAVYYYTYKEAMNIQRFK